MLYVLQNMSNSIKFILISSVICLGLGISLNALAQETSVTEEVALDEEVSAEDLEIKEPRLLPDSPFYFLKNWGRGIRSFFIFNKVKKAELKAKFANEKLIEVKKMIEEKKSAQIIKKGLENYQKEVEKVKAMAYQIKEKAVESPKVDSFLNKFTNHQILHQKLLSKLETQVPSEVFEKIEEARERHLERFGEVMTKLEDRKEKITERLEKTMEEQEGSKFKDFKNLEILKELEEKVPEQAKEAVQKAQENTLKKLQGDLEKMSSENQEKFGDYIERISGDKAKQLEILENLRFEIKEKTQLREKINEMREGIIEKVQERTREREKVCPEIDKPVSGFCSEGRIVVKKDENGCVIFFKCIIPAEIEIPTTSLIEPKPVCITLWDPVCGTNGKTYSNSCYAKLAGVEIVYKGECREKECKTDADCPQLRCGPAGTIGARCIGVKAKCVEGKCVIVEE